MCGLAGVARTSAREISSTLLRRMGGAIRHRGPDGFGLYLGHRVGLAHVRLSIIDLAGGAQPILNETGDVVVAYNGEIYNFAALTRELVARGHRFRTRSDTEVLAHGWEEWGEAMFAKLEGQFAFALYDRRDESVRLVRDRFGVRPLFYAAQGGDLYFGSEVKALLASGEVAGRPDPIGIDQALVLWGPKAPRTPFEGVHQVRPGSALTWRRGRVTEAVYWRPGYEPQPIELGDALDRLDVLLRQSVADRLVADVPVGAYLSGGLDSSVICRIANEQLHGQLRTFSLAFADGEFDERSHQELVAAALGTRHSSVTIDSSDIAADFPLAVYHAETPLMRTAPVPLLRLARHTREQGITVVLTGEGADELFLGYDLFKEVLVREFCLRQPESTRRPRLFERLYPYLRGVRGAGDFWKQFFLQAGGPTDPLFSHRPRFTTSAGIRGFYHPDFRSEATARDVVDDLAAALPKEFDGWSTINRAAFLELDTLLAGYLLSSQGDRMSLAYGVEGRYPFLDHKLFEFSARLPESLKLMGLSDKRLLRRWARGTLPVAAAARPKQPYRAPVVAPFFGEGRPSWIDELLDPGGIAAGAIFAPDAVAGLVRRCRAGRATGAREEQALVGILSTELWRRRFAQLNPVELTGRPDVVIEETQPAEAGV